MTVLKSHRTIPLICQTRGEKPIVCLENHLEWDSIQVIHPDGRLTAIYRNDFVQLFGEGDAGHLWPDRCIHPKALLLLAKEVGGNVDTVSLETAAGRWVINKGTNVGAYFNYAL